MVSVRVLSPFSPSPLVRCIDDTVEVQFRRSAVAIADYL
jgi:hypothetical protein